MSRLVDFAAALALVAALTLTACATPYSPSVQTTTIEAMRAFVAAESGFDAAVETADVAIRTGKLTAAAAARIRALADTGHGYVVSGRAAMGAIDTRGLLSESKAIAMVAVDLATLSKG